MEGVDDRNEWRGDGWMNGEEMDGLIRAEMDGLIGRDGWMNKAEIDG